MSILQRVFANGDSELKARSETTYARFPPHLIYRADEMDDPNCDVGEVYVRILVRLEHLQNLFFAERLSLRLGHIDENRLLVISFEMVSLTLLFWTHQDRFSGVRRDFEWLVSLRTHIILLHLSNKHS